MAAEGMWWVLGLVGWIGSRREGGVRALGYPKQEVSVHRGLRNICALSERPSDTIYTRVLVRAHDACSSGMGLGLLHIECG